MNLYLIGYRGTGKTTLAPRIADRLSQTASRKYASVDLDASIVESARCSIAEIFRDQGEPRFRDLESQALERIAQSDHQVVATGGGIVLRAANRAILERGIAVWLRADLETILDRLARDASRTDHRPALTSLPPREEVMRLLAEREPWYRAVSRLAIDTDRQSPDAIADEITEAWLAFQEQRGRC